MVKWVLCSLLLVFSCGEQKTVDLGDQNSIIQTDSATSIRVNTLLQKAKIFANSDQKDSAIYYYNQSLLIREGLPKDDQFIIDLLAIADIYLNEFKYEMAKRYLEKARITESEVLLEPSLQIELNRKSAEVSANMLDYATSLSFLQKNLSIISQHFHKDSLKLSGTYHLIGVNYLYTEQFIEAVNYINKSLTFIKSNDYHSLAKASSTLGTIYQYDGKPNKAIQYYNRAISYNLKLDEPLSDRLAIVYLQKAFALIDLNALDSAQYYLSTNLSIREMVYGEKNINTFGAKYSLAEFFFANSVFDSAAFYYQSSLTSLIDNFNSKSIYDNPSPSTTEFNPDLIIALVGKANSLKKLSEKGVTNVESLNESLHSYLLADSVFKIYKTNYEFDDQQLRQLAKGYIPYDNVVSVTEQLYQLTGDPNYVEVALNVMESARASILQASLKRAEMLAKPGVESSFAKKENELKKNRFEILQRLNTKDLSPSELNYLSDSLIAIDNELTVWQSGMKKINPNYYNAQYSILPIKLTDIQSYLKQQKACLIEYLWGNEFVFTIVVYSNEIKIQKIKITKELVEAIWAYSKELKINTLEVHRADHFTKFLMNSQLVYSELLAPVLRDLDNSKVEKLIISADKLLATFPFESLITELPISNEVNYHLSYLVNDFNISYVYSSRVLIDQSKTNRHGRNLIAMGFAGSASIVGKRSALNNLPGTEKELMAIKSVMKKGTNKYLLADDASETNFKKFIKDFNIAHLALHGTGDTIDALQSRLIFRSGNDKSNDGNLFAHELYDMDLKNLDLAVLSACESGVGKLQSGEGVMSIARGFAYAGCPSLVISLWKINDNTSSQIMSSFYQHLASGDQIDRSLALSKTDYLLSANEYNSHPTYWAAFLMVGDTSPIELSATYWIWLLIIAALATIAFFSYRLFNRSS